MSNAPSKPVSFSRPKVGYFSNRPRIYVDMFVADSLIIRCGKATYVTESVYQNYMNIHV